MLELFESLGISVIVVNNKPTDGKSLDSLHIKYLNPSASQLLENTLQELSGKPLTEITAANISNSPWHEALANFRINPSNNVFQLSLIKSNNKIISCLVTFSTADESSLDLIFFIQKTPSISNYEEDLSIMRLAIEQSASAIVITDSKGYIDYVNPKFSELSGYKRSELLGRNPRILQSGYTSPSHYQSMWELLLEKGHWQGEIKNKKKNGETYWANEQITAIKNNQGEITHFLAIEEDITQNRQAKSALINSEERFRQMAEMTGEWLWEQNPEGYYIYSSIAVKKILGLSPEEVMGKHYTELLTPKDKKTHQTNLINNQPFYELTNYYLNKNGPPVITESTGLPLKDSTGKIIKWRGVDRDITARKHFEDALMISEKRIRLIIESALNAIVIIDCYGIITDWNHQAEKMFGWPRNQAIGLRLDELIVPPRLREAYRKQIDIFLKTGKAKMINKMLESFAIRQDGREFPIEFSLSPLKLGNAYIFSGFIHDISARRNSEQQIRQAQIKLAIAQNEMQIAQQIQTLLLPTKALKTPQLEIAGYCLPAAQIGGDYFDYFFRDDHCLDAVIADVSGHSVGPALFMVETRSAIRAQINKSVTPSETLCMLNNALYQDLDNADYFITLFYLQYHQLSRTLKFANAGHQPPLLIRQSKNKCIRLDAEGLVIGIRNNVKFEQSEMDLEQGDLILLFTDGLIEAENKKAEFFGIDNVTDIVMEHALESPEIIIDKLLKQLKLFCKSEVFEDDITLMILKCL